MASQTPSALYAQQDAQQTFAGYGTVLPLAGSQYIGQWNWGAALLTPWWLMTHRRAPLGVLLLILSFIPLVNIIGLVSLFYFGIEGTKIAVNCGRFVTDVEFVAVENAWRNWAFGFLIVGVFFCLIAGLFGVITSQSGHH